MRQLEKILVLAFISMMISSCYNDDIQSSETIEFVNPERLYLGTIEGQVVDTLGDPIAAVVISMEGHTVMSDNDGRFTLLDVQIPETGRFISAVHPTHLEGGIRVYANAPTTQKVTISLVPNGITESFTNEQGVTLNVRDLAKVTIPSNTFLKNEKSYSGMVTLEVYLVNPKELRSNNKRIQVFESLDINTQSEILKSDLASMMYIKATDLDGQELSIAPDKSVSIELPTYGNIINDGLELFSFDSDIGFWTTDGMAENVNNDHYKANLEHFSWWGVGIQKKASTLCIEFVADTPGEDELFTVNTTNGSVVYLGHVTYDAPICFPVPEGDQLEVRVVSSCFIEITTASLPPASSGDNRATVQIPASAHIGYTIRGEVLDCDFTPFMDDVTIYYHTDLSSDSIENVVGAFEISLDPCFVPQDLLVVASHRAGNITYTFTPSGLVPIDPSKREYDIQIVACQDVIPEDGVLTIDGITYFNAIVRQNPQETVIIANNGTDEIILGIDGLSEGQYPARVIHSRSNAFCEGQAEITHYGNVGDIVSGTLEIEENTQLGCSQMSGTFRAIREK